MHFQFIFLLTLGLREEYVYEKLHINLNEIILENIYILNIYNKSLIIYRKRV